MDKPKKSIMDFDELFPFNVANNAFNCDLEILVMTDEAERYGLNDDYKRRFCNNKDG
jgi:hypothetical protein